MIKIEYKCVSYQWGPSNVNTFIDFEKTLRNAYLLDVDMLGPLLPRLKDHLERVQVCLGEIHEWAVHPSNDLSHLGIDFRQVVPHPSVMLWNCYDECSFCLSEKNGCSENKCAELTLLKRIESSLVFDNTDEGGKGRLSKFVDGIAADTRSVSAKHVSASSDESS